MSLMKTRVKKRPGGGKGRRKDRKDRRRLDKRRFCKQCYKKMIIDYRCVICGSSIHPNGCSMKINGEATNYVDKWYCFRCVDLEFPEDDNGGYKSNESSEF
jgi:hypothetical protein